MKNKKKLNENNINKEVENILGDMDNEIDNNSKTINSKNKVFMVALLVAFYMCYIPFFVFYLEGVAHDFHSGYSYIFFLFVFVLLVMTFIVSSILKNKKKLVFEFRYSLILSITAMILLLITLYFAPMLGPTVVQLKYGDLVQPNSFLFNLNSIILVIAYFSFIPLAFILKEKKYSSLPGSMFGVAGSIIVVLFIYFVMSFFCHLGGACTF